jgi:SAM-dependent methyltransferase
MPNDDQKRERLEAAVRSCYSTWGKSYYREYYGATAPYPPVHVELMRQLLLGFGARTMLDAGCGPASFLRHLAHDSLDLYGFDLTGEMVEEGRHVLSELGLNPARIWQGSVLDRGAFSGPPDSGCPAHFDAVVCVGVMPHVAAESDSAVFYNLHSALRTDGLAIVEARNQLFSLFTLNRPSYEFVRNELMRADDLLARSGDARPRLAAELEAMQRHFRMDLPPIRRGKAGEPGYDEVVSRTHNPLIARRQLAASGFRDVRVLFYHFHAAPPQLAAAVPELFLRESLAMEDPDDWRGYFMASAFLLVGRKA